MSYRFPVFVLVVLLGLGLIGFGLFANHYAVYEKPDPRDAGQTLNAETLHRVGEIEFTGMVARERVIRDEWGHLIDRMQEAPCFS